MTLYKKPFWIANANRPVSSICSFSDPINDQIE